MKEIYTQIVINASPETVWSVLTNFDDYPNWNPFIVSLTGDVQVGEKIKITLSPPDSNKMIFKPKILKFIDNSEIEWLGHLILPGLFDGTHSFTIVDHGDNTVTFIQREKFEGILVPLFSKMLDYNTKTGFNLMNEKLKEICEDNNI